MKDRLAEAYRLLHRNDGFCKGSSIKDKLDDIGACLKKYGCKSLLDYGCGKAMFYDMGVHVGWGIEELTLYDPGVEKYSRYPEGQFDGVVCTDVLEHIPPEDVDEFIEELLKFPTKVLYAAVCCSPSPPQKKLPDGRPLHLTVEPPEWWEDKFAGVGIPVELRFT